MQIRPEQLYAHLQKTIAPLYILWGETHLLLQEARDAIWAAAQKKGYAERQIFQVETGFSWPHFLNAADSLSLFSDKQFFELRLSGLPGDAGNKALQAYIQKPHTDKILLISFSKLDAATQKTNWFQALAKKGVTIPIWPLDKNQLSLWISQRLQRAELTAEPAAIQILAELAEGNLLACAQEIEKLRLVYGSTHLNVEHIIKAVGDNARFDVFALGDAVLEGEPQRLIRILSILKEEGIEPILILWALAREFRNLALISAATTQGVPLDQAMQKQRIWEKRKPLVKRALQKHSLSKLYHLLSNAGKIDKMIKGVITGNTWVALEKLALGVDNA